MPENETLSDPQRVSRRSAISGALAMAGGAAAFGQASAAEPSATKAPPPRDYDMKKSINLWAFLYPDRMSLEQCLRLAKDAGFDGIELNYDLENDLSPKAGTKDLHKIRKLADGIGIAISGLCSF